VAASPNVALARSSSAPESGKSSRASHNIALGYLRTFAVLLVLAHHSALAYVPGIPTSNSLTTVPHFWEAFPILDSRHAAGFGVFSSFNDIFFMSLLFFLSGLFVWGSLQRKGTRVFMRDRMIRLALPFVFAAAVVAPLAYYPAYAIRSGDPHVAGFTRQWFSLGEWPSGPAWFIWVLLVFDCLAAVLYAGSPKIGEWLGTWCSAARRSPARFYLLLAVVGAVAYVPMVTVFGPSDWTGFGPFAFQKCRIFHYAVYFLMGVGVGAYGIDRGLLAPDGMLARRWLRWTIAMPLVFITLMAFVITAITAMKTTSPLVLNLIGGSLFELSCGASCFAFMALFVRFIKRRTSIRDSLSENEYGMYLIHYAFVSWLGYAMLTAPMPAVAKFALVFAGVVAMSWVSSATLRSIPGVARAV